MELGQQSSSKIGWLLESLAFCLMVQNSCTAVYVSFYLKYSFFIMILAHRHPACLDMQGLNIPTPCFLRVSHSRIRTNTHTALATAAVVKAIQRLSFLSSSFTKLRLLLPDRSDSSSFTEGSRIIAIFLQTPSFKLVDNSSQTPVAADVCFSKIFCSSN